MKSFALAALMLLFMWPVISNGQNNTANCKFLHHDHHSPAATFEDIAWLEGHWQGEAFGGATEEIWTHEAGGAMMGAFRLVKDSTVELYELMTITRHKNSLVLKIKHSNADLQGWEEKHAAMEFLLVHKEPGKMYFDGLTMEKISDTELNIYVVMDEAGKKDEVKFAYKRAVTP